MAPRVFQDILPVRRGAWTVDLEQLCRHLRYSIAAISCAGSAHGWADVTNTFNVCATGGVWFVTGVDILSHQATTGPYVNAGAGLGPTSDRAVKENSARWTLE